MQQFEVDDDLVELVWKLADPKPFESLTFSTALRRVLLERNEPEFLEGLGSPIMKKAPTPRAEDWVALVHDLSEVRGLTTWKAICDYLGIDPAGDSARRKLKIWASVNRPDWPQVPDPK